MEKLLSVIIPVYNAEKTLTPCIRSVLDQTQNCTEILLVDDGSWDSSPVLCDTLAEKYPEIIRVIHQQNAGSLVARMTGTAAAEGEYLMYVDADDVLLPGAIARVREDISGGADLYLYDYIMDAVGGADANTVHLMEYAQTTEFSPQSKTEVSHAFMKGMMNTVCATAIRRAFLQGLELRFPQQKLRHGEDRLQKLQMLATAKRIVYVPQAFYHYKWYPGTQGGDLRSGIINREIYENFRLTWSIEREHYAALGFDREESCRYDRKKLTRICGLLEASFCKKELTGEETADMICMLSCDALFCQLSSAELLSGVRAHIRRGAALIRQNRAAILKTYWRLCHFVRKLRYR